MHPSWVAVVLAAGAGSRFGGPKQWAPLWGCPVALHSLAVLAGHPAIRTLVLVTDPDTMPPRLADLLAQGFPQSVHLVRGGATRQRSLENACDFLLDQGLVPPGAMLLVHDGARPLVTRQDADAVMAASGEHGAAFACLPLDDTLHRLDAGGRVCATPRRQGLVRALTPQAFPFSALHRGLKEARAHGRRFTDEAALMAWQGMAAMAVPAGHHLTKVTTPDDLDLVRRLSGPVLPGCGRVGEGMDIHAYVPDGRPLKLGGELMPGGLKVAAHSDGDVLAHAVTDALLGAAGLPDLGTLFPDTDPAFDNADSMALLARGVAMLKERGLRPAGLDVTLLADRPKLAPQSGRIRANLAAALKISGHDIGLKATTFEGLGFIGQGRGLAIFCVAVVIMDSTNPRNTGP